MITFIALFVPFLMGTLFDIPIEVSDTHPIPYATDIQDISVDWQQGHLAIRSNTDGVIYIADNETFEYISEIPLPTGASGFGLSAHNGHYYINSDTGPFVFHSDASGVWSSFGNPAGTSGAGMDSYTMGPDLLFEISATAPHQLYSIETDGSAYDTYPLEDNAEEISGFMGYEPTALNGDPPAAALVTTRFGHEIYFYQCYSGGGYLVGQEPCPIPVLESLGLAYQFSGMNDVLWSYKDLDGQYYIAELWIPVFGAIEDDLTGFPGQTASLQIGSNPASGSALFSVSSASPGYSILEVFDVSGRLVQTLHSGQLTGEENSFYYQGSPGLYIAVLRCAGAEQNLKFVLTR